VTGSGRRPKDIVDEHASKGRVSTVLHRIGTVTSHQLTPVVVAAVALAWIVVWLVADRPEWMMQSLETAAAVVTLVMVFVIQHTQHRIQRATQLKLDGIVQGLPEADDALVKAEAGTDDELERRTDGNLRYRNRMRSR
jgi:low affinity Fe/Cu permease